MLNSEILGEKISDFLKIIVYPLFIYLGMDKEIFVILMILMMGDSLTGGIKAIRIGREFRFKTMLWGICIKLLILLVPMVVALVAKALGQNFTIAVSWAMSVLIVSEGYSILGNIYDAKNRTDTKSLDLVSMVLKKLRSKLSNILTSQIETIEKEVDCKLPGEEKDNALDQK